MLLVACETTTFNTLPGKTCPGLVEYTKQEEDKAAAELELHPSILNWFMDNYRALRKNCK